MGTPWQYEVLGLHHYPPPTLKEASDAYRALALQYHPDKNPDNPVEATAKFQVIGQAFADVQEDIKIPGSISFKPKPDPRPGAAPTQNKKRQPPPNYPAETSRAYPPPPWANQAPMPAMASAFRRIPKLYMVKPGIYGFKLFGGKAKKAEREKKRPVKTTWNFDPRKDIPKQSNRRGLNPHSQNKNMRHRAAQAKVVEAIKADRYMKILAEGSVPHERRQRKLLNDWVTQHFGALPEGKLPEGKQPVLYNAETSVSAQLYAPSWKVIEHQERARPRLKEQHRFRVLAQLERGWKRKYTDHLQLMQYSNWSSRMRISPTEFYALKEEDWQIERRAAIMAENEDKRFVIPEEYRWDPIQPEEDAMLYWETYYKPNAPFFNPTNFKYAFYDYFPELAEQLFENRALEDDLDIESQHPGSKPPTTRETLKSSLDPLDLELAARRLPALYEAFQAKKAEKQAVIDRHHAKRALIVANFWANKDKKRLETPVRHLTQHPKKDRLISPTPSDDLVDWLVEYVSEYATSSELVLYDDSQLSDLQFIQPRAETPLFGIEPHWRDTPARKAAHQEVLLYHKQQELGPLTYLTEEELTNPHDWRTHEKEYWTWDWFLTEKLGFLRTLFDRQTSQQRQEDRRREHVAWYNQVYADKLQELGAAEFKRRYKHSISPKWRQVLALKFQEEDELAMAMDMDDPARSIEHRLDILDRMEALICTEESPPKPCKDLVAEHLALERGLERKTEEELVPQLTEGQDQLGVEPEPEPEADQNKALKEFRMSRTQLKKLRRIEKKEAEAESAARKRELKKVQLSHLAALVPKKDKVKKPADSGSGDGYKKFLK